MLGKVNMYTIRLSPYHKIFYNEWKIDHNSNIYNIVFDQTLTQNLDIERLKNALYRFIKDHLIFNSHISEEDDEETYWVVNNQIKFLEEFKSDEGIYEYVSQPFDLTKGCLYRFGLFKQGINYRLIIVLHHIVIDGSKGDPIIKKISHYYNHENYKDNKTYQQQIEELTKVTDSVYVKLEQISKSANQFWKNELASSEDINLFFIKPTGLTLQNNSINHIRNIQFIFSAEVINKLKQTYPGISIYIYSQVIFAILISRYTLQSKFTLNYPVAIKEYLNLYKGVGVNTNLCFYDIRTTTNIIDLITEQHNFIKDIKKCNYSYYPINQIINGHNKKLLEMNFIQTNLKDIPFDFNDVKVLSISQDFEIDLPAKICFGQQLRNNILKFQVKYNTQEIDEAILNQFIYHYQKLFIDVLEDLEKNNTQKLISQYQILDWNEYQKIVYDWNNTTKSYPFDKTIHQLFEEQVEKTPDNIAIVYENVELTYQELNKRANQLAHYLVKRYQIKSDELIALCLNRSEGLLITILAVLKAGGAYLPIEPNLPQERMLYILKDANTRLLLINEIHAIKFSFIQDELPLIQTLAIDSVKIKNSLVKFSKANLSQAYSNKNLAYVLYTSGTTGTPKGVMVSHKNVVSLVKNVDYISITANDCTMQLADIAFDAATFEIWGTILNGAKLYIPTCVLSIISDISLLKSTMDSYRISILWLTKTLFDQLYLHDNTLFHKLSYLLVGGEALNYELVHKLVNSENRPKHFINGYGPTENTTFSCTFEVRPEYLLNVKSVPIGRPFTNRLAYVLDSNLNPIPIGAIGELYVGGDGVTKGYLNNLELTQKSFIKNPFQTEIEKQAGKNLWLYKTGDLVRYLADGNIEYIGRDDFQIKLRGYRVELNEIENRLTAYSGITQAIVEIKESDTENKNSANAYLIGYYVADTKLNENDIMDYLASYLPDCMLPTVLVHITSIPLTINGKLDRNSLPKPLLIQHQHVKPRNNTEDLICNAFSNVLGIGKVGIDDNFFQLGGNSILAIKLVITLQHNFELNVNQVFMLKTPRKLAETAIRINNNLPKKLHLIKQMLPKSASIKYHNKVNLEKTKYLEQIHTINFQQKIKSIKTILLTGATGYLGCHILYYLLIMTDHKLYVLVRALNNDEAYLRLHKKFKYYFDVDLENYRDRIMVLASNLEKEYLGLTTNVYQELIRDVDRIIHSAALVKHYGTYKEFYEANVQSTINLLELAKLTKLKDFHYVSTKGVFMDGYIPDCEYYLFNEDSDVEILHAKTNLYIRTKSEAEKITIQYRAYGINTNIYRVGNIFINSQTYKPQENIEENAFFTSLKTMLDIGIIPKELSEVEISPVDCTALAIIKLSGQAELKNQIYHVFNPNSANLFKLINEFNQINVKMEGISDFIDDILLCLQNKNKDNYNIKQIELFMLHQKWLQDIDSKHVTAIEIAQDKTNHILSQLNFKWPQITSNMLSNIVVN